MKKIALALCCAALASACTPRPAAIAPVSMTGVYDSSSCSYVVNTLNAKRAELARLEAQQNTAATADAIGVFLILVPVSKASGGDRAGDIAVLKGEVLALEQRLARCGF